MYYIWRSDSPANAAPFEHLDAGLRALVAAAETVADPAIEWCLVHARDDAPWETVVCTRYEGE